MKPVYWVAHGSNLIFKDAFCPAALLQSWLENRNPKKWIMLSPFHFVLQPMHFVFRNKHHWTNAQPLKEWMKVFDGVLQLLSALGIPVLPVFWHGPHSLEQNSVPLNPWILWPTLSLLSWFSLWISCFSWLRWAGASGWIKTPRHWPFPYHLINIERSNLETSWNAMI